MERLARRLSGRGWAFVPLASIVLVVVAIGAANATADGLTWLALIAVPPLAASALGATMRGGRPPLALLGGPAVRARVVAIAERCWARARRCC